MTADGMTSFGYGDNETVTSHGATIVSACRDVSAVTCVDSGPGAVGSGGVYYSDNGLAAGVSNHWVFVLTPNVHIAFHGHGWLLHRSMTPTRLVIDVQADDNEVNVIGESASVFSTASADGGSGGSLAQAVPPCSNAHVPPLREGVGTFTLTGGTRLARQQCPGLAIGQAIGGWAPRATTWRASGPVLGASTLSNARLLVVDTPKSWIKR
jgi:hypothetical protein